MKKILALSLALITILPVSVLALTETVTATPAVPTIPKLDPKNNYCLGLPGSKLLFRAHQLVWNDADSGDNGNYWALDNYERYFWVYQYTNGGTHYCAVVQYLTNPYAPGFVTFAGESPGLPIVTIPAGIKE